MAKELNKKKEEEKKTISDAVLEGLESIRNFLFKHRKTVLLSLLGLVIILIAGGVVFAIQRANENNALELYFRADERLPKNLPEEYNLSKLSQLSNYSEELSIPVDFKMDPDLNKVDTLIPSFREVADKSDSAAGYLAKYYIGLLNYFKQSYEPAIDAFKSVSKKRSFFLSPVSQFNISLCYEKLGDFESALSEYQQLVTNFPKHPIKELAMLQMARCNKELKKYDKALEYCEEIAKDPTNSYTNEVKKLKILIEWEKSSTTN